MKRTIFIFCFVLFFFSQFYAQNKILIPMDMKQTDHLKSYGVTFSELQKGNLSDWLMNYRGGSFLFDYSDELALKCRLRGVAFEVISPQQTSDIYAYVQGDEQNMDVVRLE